MKVLKMTAVIGVEVDDDRDPEEVAASFDNGLLNAVSGWPGGEVVGATVETIVEPSEAEIDERGWSE